MRVVVGVAAETFERGRA